MEEPVEVPVVPEPEVTTPATPATPAAEDPKVIEELEKEDAEGFSVMQKGLFFAVIIGCVAMYIKVRGRKSKRFAVKSMA